MKYNKRSYTKMKTFLDSCQNWVCSMLDTVRTLVGDWSLPPSALDYYYVCSGYMMSLCDKAVLLEGRFLQYINFMSVSEVMVIIVLFFNVYNIVRSSRRYLDMLIEQDRLYCRDKVTRPVFRLARFTDFEPKPKGAEPKGAAEGGRAEGGQSRRGAVEVSTMTDMRYDELESMVSQYLIQLGAERSKNRMLSRQLQILKGVRREKMEMEKLKKYVMLRGGKSDLLDGWSIRMDRGRKVYYCDLKGKCWKTLKDAGDVLNLSPLYKTRGSL